MNTLRKTALWIILCWVQLFLATSAFASPSTTGSTGMIRIPTADILQTGHFAAGYYYWQDHGTAVAALGLPAGIEVSAAAPWYNGVSSQWNVNAKINLTQESLLTPGISVGIEDLGGQRQQSFYGVVSKALPFGLRVHLGIGNGRFRGAFGAVEKVLNPQSVRKKNAGFPVTSIIVEMDGRKMNYGARMRLARGLRLDAGWLGLEERIYLGLTYTN